MFKAQIFQFAHLYKKDQQPEINKFIAYWCEKSPRGRKMRFEKEKTFDPKRRLVTWFDNVQKWGKKEPVKKLTAAEALNKKING